MYEVCTDQKYSRTFKQKGREESCEMDDPEPGQKICQLYLIENWQLFYGNFIRPKIKVGTEWVIPSGMGVVWDGCTQR